MELDDALYKNFLTELESLEKFRMGYTALYKAVPLGREDQDVQRLIEAMALFSARTRLAGQRAISRTTMRLFQQHFPYVLSPLPALAMLQAVPKDRGFVNAVELPRGTRVVLSPTRQDTSAPPLAFHTLAPLRIQPLHLRQVYTRPRQDGVRVLLNFASDSERHDTPGSLLLHINHLNEFLSSLAVFHQLKQDLRGARVFFGRFHDEDSLRDARPCEVSFGLPRPPPAATEPFEHPLQRLRSCFHFPQQELFLEARLPEAPPRWQHFTLCLDLAASWPTELVLTQNTFMLHAVPMVNLQRELSNPIEHDGTKERQGVRHPEPGGGYRVHSLLGVYRMEEKGLRPLRPGTLSGGRDTYEVEHEGKGEARATWLSLNLPDAFARPVRVAVEACWHQPLAPDFDVSGYRTRLAGRFLEGLEWRTVGAVVPSKDNRIEHSSQDLLQLLAIRNQRFLGLEELDFLLKALGVHDERYFRPLVEGISSVQLRPKPFAKSSTGFKYIYRIAFSHLDPILLPTIDLFSSKLLELLRAWSTEEVVELEVTLPYLDKPLNYPPREHP
jgi:type VI secretion system protein ImpG